MGAVGLAVALAGVSCKEKPADATTEVFPKKDKTIMEKVEDAVRETVEDAGVELTVEERAAKLGFAKYLPAESEMVIATYNIKSAADSLKGLKLYQLIGEGMGVGADGAGGGFDNEELLLEDEEVVAPEAEQEANGDDDVPAGEEAVAVPADEAVESAAWTLLGREVTIAFGKGAGAQLADLQKLEGRAGYFQAVAAGRAIQKMAEAGEEADFGNLLMEALGTGGAMKELLTDPQTGLGLMERLEFPPLYVAFRAAEGKLEEAARMIGESMGILGMGGEAVEMLEFETGGGNFSGYRIIGVEVAKILEGQRTSMEEEFDAATFDRILEIVRKKNLVIASGTVGEYVVLMIGSDQERLALVDSAAESVVMRKELDFVDGYGAKNLLAMGFWEKGSYGNLQEGAGMIGEYALGLGEGISGGKGLGDTRDLESVLRIVAEREKSLLALGSTDDLGLIAYIEDGVKIEKFGGHQMNALDRKAENRLAHLGESGNPLLYFNMTTDEAYDEKAAEYFEAIFEAIYAGAMKFSDMRVSDPNLMEIKQMLLMFNDQFREDALGVYATLSESLGGGLGRERAVVIDLEGAVPAMPGLPREVVEEGKAPRISIIAPVEDREKLSKGWDEISERAASLLGKLGDATGEDIPMQKPISSEQDGIKTWFISMPFFQDDFLPSVTVDDKFFAISTSKNHAVDLVKRAGEGGTKSAGMRLHVNFGALREYGEETLALVDKHAAKLFLDEGELVAFQTNKADYRKVLDAMRDFESLEWTARKENGQARSSIHFRVK